MAGTTALEAGLGVLQAVLPVNSLAVLTVTMAVGNAFLRVVTTHAVEK